MASLRFDALFVQFHSFAKRASAARRDDEPHAWRWTSVAACQLATRESFKLVKVPKRAESVSASRTNGVVAGRSVPSSARLANQAARRPRTPRSTMRPAVPRHDA